MTPTQFKEAVEGALQKYAEYYIGETMKFFQEKGESPALSKNNRGDTEALAAIQTATAELIEGIIGEDNLEAVQDRNLARWAAHRNRLRGELRQKAKELKQ